MAALKETEGCPCLKTLCYAQAKDSKWLLGPCKVEENKIGENPLLINPCADQNWQANRKTTCIVGPNLPVLCSRILCSYEKSNGSLTKLLLLMLDVITANHAASLRPSAVSLRLNCLLLVSVFKSDCHAGTGGVGTSGFAPALRARFLQIIACYERMEISVCVEAGRLAKTDF